MGERQRARLSLVQSSLTYRDSRLAELDAAVLMEVVEHLDLPRLPALERTVFGAAKPRIVVVTTRTSNTTPDTKRCRWALSGIVITDSNGRVANFGCGRTRRRRRTDTGCGTCPSAPTIPKWARQRKWLSFRSQNWGR